MTKFNFSLFLAMGLIFAGPVKAAPPSVVPLDVMSVSQPVPVKGEDGTHLLYEVRLSNFAPREVELESIDVIGTNDVLQRYDAAALITMIGTPGQVKEESAALKISPGSFAILFFDTILPKNAALPSQLSLRVHIKNADLKAPASRKYLDTQPMRVSLHAPEMLGPPLLGDGWVAANALSNTNDHRRTIAVVDGKARIAQRYAIDFVKLDAEGRAFRGDPNVNDAWAGYGKDVLAVADGRIDTVWVGVPDNIPGSGPAVPINLDTIGGNHIVLALPDGAHVFYGHLKPDSIIVHEGDRVRKGQVIAKVGNSGQSDAPHLHIHVADGASALGAEGLAYAFESFKVEGHVPSLAILESTTGWKPAGEPDERHEELPIENAVVSFGGKPAG